MKRRPDGPDRSTFFSRLRWALGMAARDLRSHPGRFLGASLPVVLGIAILVAVESFRDNLETTVERQSRSLLGADLALTSRQSPGPELEAFLTRVPGERSEEIQFSSMLLVPGTGETRLVQVRSIRGEFPWYGRLETTPEKAFAAQREGVPGIIVEESLRLQLGLTEGDELSVGELRRPKSGRLLRAPGEAGAVGLIAPRIYLAWEDLPATGLLGDRSLARYRFFFRLPEEVSAEKWVADHEDQINALRLEVDTVERRREGLAQSLDMLAAFLHLTGFTALLLGAIGVGSAIRVWVEGKKDQMALLRCLGARASTARGTIVAQVVANALWGSLAGVSLGVGLQYLLPWVLRDFLPFSVDVSLAPAALAGGGLFGLGFTLLFALPPLLGLRDVPPLGALREGFGEGARKGWMHQWPLLAVGGLIFAFAYFQLRSAGLALAYTGGLVGLVAILWLIARLFLLVLPRAIPSRAPWIFRQSLANLYRPRNQTALVLGAIGLSTAFVLTLLLLRGAALANLDPGGGEDGANLAFFDLQEDQRETLGEILARAGLEAREMTPVVTMRITRLGGRPVEDWLAENRVPRWTLQREYRSTYRGQLNDAEKITAGEWIETADLNTQYIPISVEEGLVREWGLELGDEIEWNVQGVPVRTVIASLREVDWRQMRPNFFVVFPTGVLEGAPQFYVAVTRAPDEETSARVQREVIQTLPNVSAIDLTLILETIGTILNRVGFVIRFMALFTIVTGLILLLSVIAAERRQRMREAFLLRTLGASRKTIQGILCGEYLLLGGLAALSGCALALPLTWVLTRRVLDLPFVFSPLPIAGTFLLILSVTLAAGLLVGTRGLNRSPLPALRGEG